MKANNNNNQTIASVIRTQAKKVHDLDMIACNKVPSHHIVEVMTEEMLEFFMQLPNSSYNRNMNVAGVSYPCTAAGVEKLLNAYSDAKARLAEIEIAAQNLPNEVAAYHKLVSDVLGFDTIQYGHIDLVSEHTVDLTGMPICEDCNYCKAYGKPRFCDVCKKRNDAKVDNNTNAGEASEHDSHVVEQERHVIGHLMIIPDEVDKTPDQTPLAENDSADESDKSLAARIIKRFGAMETNNTSTTDTNADAEEMPEIDLPEVDVLNVSDNEVTVDTGDIQAADELLNIGDISVGDITEADEVVNCNDVNINVTIHGNLVMDSFNETK